jgi:VCBS repeat-containing protein
MATGKRTRECCTGESMTDLGGGWFERKRTKKSSPADKPRKRRRTIGIMALEPRVMYDGAAVATAAAAHHIADHPHDHGSSGSHADSPSNFLAPAVGGVASNNNHHWDHANDATGIAHQGMHPGDTVVFVDSQIADYQAIVSAMDPSVRIIVYDGTQDGLHEIAQDLKGVHGLAAIDIISHGSSGEVQLGTDVLTTSNLSDHAADLAAIGKALAANGQIDLYGCDIAAGGDGFLDALKAATGRDVAASTDATGSSDLGGNWTLEASTGLTASALPADANALTAYHGLLADTLSATQTTTLTGDTDGDGVPDPGETVTTAVTITNNSTVNNASGVTLSETLNGMTQTGSVTVTPIAANDSYTLVGNTPITISAGNGVLANDLSPDGGALTATSLVTSAATHGSVTFNSDGSFTYTPTTGFAGTATFTYIAHDATGLNSNGTGTVTLTVTDPIWYVDSSAAGGGDGSFGHAFQTVQAAVTAAASNGQDSNQAQNDTIFVYNRGATYTSTSGITLAAGEQLLGDGSSLTSVNGNTIGVASTNPTFQVTGNSVTALTLASNNTISGINISETGTSGNGIVDGGSVGTLHFINIGVSATGNGISLTHGGTVDATGTNTLSSSGGTALDVANTTIGSANLTFKSISDGSSSSSAGDGIILDTTGSSGGLHVTGDGSTAGSGGTIQHKTGADLLRTSGIGIYLNNTVDVELAYMQLNDFSNFGIRAFGVTGFTLDHSSISGTNGTNAAPNGLDDAGEGDVYFGGDDTTETSVTGIVNLTNDSFSGGAARNVSINESSGTTYLTLSSDTFGLNQSGANQSLLIQAWNSNTTIDTSLTGSTFAGAASDDVNFTGQTGTVMNVVVTGNTMSNTHPGNIIGGGSLVLATQGKLVFDVESNTMTGANGSAVTLFKASAGTDLEGTFNNNTIGTSGVVNSGSKTGNGIFLSAAGGGNITLTITNNIIQDYSGNGGIYFDNTGGSYAVNLTITGNTVRQPGSNAFTGLAITNGSPGSSDSTNVFALISNNDFSAGDPTNSGDVYLGASGSTSSSHTFTLSGASAANVASESAIENFIMSSNNLNGASANTVVVAYTDSPVTFSAFKASSSAPPAAASPKQGTLSTSSISGTAQEGGTLTATAATGDGGATITYQWQENFGSGFSNITGATNLTYHPIEADEGATLRIVATSTETGKVSATTISSATAAVSDHLTLTTPVISGTVQQGQVLTASAAVADNSDATVTYQWQRDGVNISGATGLSYRPSAGDVGHTLDIVASATDTHSGSTSATSGVTGAVTAAPTFSLPTINIGALPANKSVTITWQATINAQTDQFIVNPVNQGSVTSNFATVNTNSVTTTLDSLTLGDQIYNDVDVSSTFDAGDIGIDGVHLTLFDDTNHNGVYDAGIDLAVSGPGSNTAVTSGGGLYSFSGLAPGEYIVRVDASNFTGGGALAAYKNASPVTDTTPNDNINNDNNGKPLSGGFVVTNAITLSYNNEPTAGTGNDTNNTLDIGFIQNRPPVIDLDANDSTSVGTGYATTFTEKGAAVAIADTDVSVTDPDNTTLKSATITITNYQAGQDVLAFTANGNTGDIAINTNAGGVLTLVSAGGATFAQWQAALQAVTYSDTSNDPLATDRSIAVVVDDGEASNHASNTAIATVHITPVNDPPTLNATTKNLTFTEDGAAVDLFDSVSISTVEAGQTIIALALTVSNVSEPASEILTIDGSSVALTNGNSVTTSGNGFSVSVTLSGTDATVTLSKVGGVSSSTMAGIVDGMTYKDTSQNPTAADRFVTLTSIQDNGGTSHGGVDTSSLNLASKVTVVPVNDNPVVANAGNSIAYTELASPAIVDSGLTVSDVDNTTLAGATAQITSGLVTGDELRINGNLTGSIGAITYSYASGTGKMTLSGSDTLADYQAALRLVTYDSTSHDPTVGGSNTSRTVTWQADDGSGVNNLSVAVTSTVNITAVNDAPAAAITPPGGGYAVGEGSDLDLKTGLLAVSDVDGGSGTETATLSVSEGILTVTAGTSGALVTNSGTSTVTITGTIAQINDLLSTNATSTVVYNDNTVVPKTTTLNLSVNDGGNTGAGGAQTSNLASADITVTKSDHAPVGNADSYVASENTTLIVGAPAGVLANDTDADGDAITVSQVNTLSGNVGTPITTTWGGTATVNADGSFTYTPATNFTGTDSFTYRASDGTLSSNVTTVTLTVNAADATPVVAASGNTVSYTEAGIGTAVDSALTLTSSTDLVGATVAIANPISGDELRINGLLTGSIINGGNTINYSYAGGVMTITGSDTVGDYQAALRLIAFDSSSQNPTSFGTDAGRLVTFTVTDGTHTSDGGTDTVGIVAVDDAPVVTTPVAHYSATEQTSIDLKNANLSVSDVDNNATTGGIETATLSVSEGIINVTSGTSGTVVGNSGTSSVTISGTLDQINALLQNAGAGTLSYIDTSDDPASSVTLTLSVNDNGYTGIPGSATGSNTATIDITPVNDPPTLSATASNPNFTEAPGLGTQAAAVTVFTGANASTIEAGQSIAELDFTVSGLVDGANETIVVDGTTIALGANSTGSSTNVDYAVTVAAGSATIALTSSTGLSTAAADTLINNIAYKNTNLDDPTAGNRVFTLTSIKDDGGILNSGHDTSTLSIASTVNVVPTNDAPTLSATASNPTFTEGTGSATQGAAVAVFTGANASTIEAGQTVTELDFSVSGLVDGANETVLVDGSTIALGANSSGTTATNGMSYNVTFGGGTATIALTKAGGVSAAALDTLIDGIQYENTNLDNPTAGNRAFTLTSIKDSGGISNGGVDTSSLSAASTVDVLPVNDAPVVNLGGATLSYTENAAAAAIAPTGLVTDVDSADFNGGSLTVHFSANGAAEDQLSILTDASVSVSAGTVSVNGLAVGSVTGGVNSADLVIAFNTNNATQTAISTLIEHIGYANSSDDPSTAARSVSFTVVDGDGTANSGTDTGSDTATINITAVNDAPVAHTSQTTYGAQAGVTLDLKHTLSVSDVDGENGSETITLSVAEGVLNVTNGGTSAIVTNSGTSTVTIQGSIADLNALLDTDGTSTVQFVDNAPALVSIPLTLRIDDNGNTGGGNLSSTATANIVFDAPPVLSNAGNTITYIELENPAPILDAGITVSDPDAPGSGTQINSATVTIGSAFTGDELRINGNLSGTFGSGADAIAYNFGGGVMTLTSTGSAVTMADYQAALQLVTFGSTSHNPDNFGTDPTRTITWEIKDIDDVASAPVTTTVNITAVNDPALVTGAVTGSVIEDGGVANGTPGTPTATGTLHDIDVDNTPNDTFQSASGVASDKGFGTYAMTAGGNWTYTLDNSNATVEALNNGETVNDTFSVQTADGTSQQVTITIHGTNDAAVITGTTSGLIVEAGGDNNSIVNIPTLSATLVSTDVDNNGTFQPVTDPAVSDNGYGTYTMTTGGTWTYTLDNNSAAVQALQQGQVVTDSFTVHSIDGTAQLITFTVNGSNDAPTITAVGNFTYDANKHLTLPIDPTLNITDPDTANLVGATVTIATGQQPEDVLGFVNQNGISGSFDPLTGVLTLTGNSSAANYKTALESVTFTSTTIKTGQRTIVWSADDGVVNGVSAPVTTSMFVLGEQNPPSSPAIPPPAPYNGFTPPENSNDTGGTTVGDGGNGDFAGDGIAAVTYVTTDLVTSTDADGLFHVQVQLLDLTAPLNGNVASIFAEQADGEPLPDWLQFDPSTGIFTGHIPPDAHGILTVQVIVRDSAGHESVMQIKFDLSKGKAGWNLPIDRGFGHDPWSPDHSIQPRRHAATDLDRDVATLVGHTILPRDGHYDGPLLAADRAVPAGRSGLSEQLRNAGWQGMNAQRMALLESLRQSATAPN